MLDRVLKLHRVPWATFRNFWTCFPWQNSCNYSCYVLLGFSRLSLSLCLGLFGNGQIYIAKFVDSRNTQICFVKTWGLHRFTRPQCDQTQCNCFSIEIPHFINLSFKRKIYWQDHRLYVHDKLFSTTLLL